MRLKIRAEGSFWLQLALMVLTLPVPWMAAAALAAVIHELFHLGVLCVQGIGVYGLRIRAGGAVMDTAPMGDREELLSALAGPVGSLLLLFGLHRFPRLALCGLVQGLYNLIPFGSLDGARALTCAIRLIRGKIPCKPEKMRVQ